MLDLETLSTRHNAAVIQLAAVQFNPVTGETFGMFNKSIGLESLVLIGADISQSTTNWWKSQSQEAKDKVLLNFSDKRNVQEVLEDFALWLRAVGAFNDVTLWGNGPAFDMSKLAATYELLGKEKPWKYSNERCVRTLVALKPDVKTLIQFDGTAHDAIDDCLHQIKLVNHVFQHIVYGVNAEIAVKTDDTDGRK
jgi:hypothetical protein